ncbi:MAG: carbohydrate ABC transporter permease [Spirochaetota bacterium]
MADTRLTLTGATPTSRPVHDVQGELARARARRRVRHAFEGAAYALPGMLLLAVFRFWPMIFGTWISFFKWGFVRERFVGLQHYATILTDDLIYTDPMFGLQVGDFGQSVLVTLYYAVGTIPIAIAAAFLIAYSLFYHFRNSGRAALRTVFFLPYITSQVASMMVFKWIFHPQVGIANAVLSGTPIGAQEWLSDAQPLAAKIMEAFGGVWPAGLPTAFGGPSLALLIIMIFAVWHTVGFNTVVFLAGFSAMPAELMDAARIDGAGGWARIRYVVIPLLSPTIFFLSVVSVIASFESFSAFYVFSNGEGTPLGTTMALPLYIFRNFYVYGRAGYASALSVVLFIILLSLTLLQRRIAERRVHYEHG